MSEAGLAALCYRGRERYIQQRRWREGRKDAKKGKDEIIVEMSEM